MWRHSAKMSTVLLVCFLVVWSCFPLYVSTENNIGCLFSLVCDPEEQCVDDNAFGRCQLPMDISVEEQTLDYELTKILEQELERLFTGGYRWKHAYTQCVVQNIFYSYRNKISYDPGFCARLMRFTLPEVPPDLLTELESPDPDELAFIKYKPNKGEPESELYAAEIFTPPIFSERENRENPEKRAESEEVQWSRKFHQPRGTENPTNKEALIDELLKTAKDTERLFESLKDPGDRYPDDEIPAVKTDLSADNTHKSIFTEGERKWTPLENNFNDNYIEGELIYPYDKKHVKVIEENAKDYEDLGEEYFDELRPHDKANGGGLKMDNHHKSGRDLNIKNQELGHGWPNEKGMMIGFESKKEKHKFKEVPTFGKSSLEEEERNFHWNPRHRNTIMDNDLTTLIGKKPHLNVQRIKSEPSDGKNNINDVIENDYLEDQLYTISDKELSTFTRNMRYDIKKPGPTYMLHEDEDGASDENHATFDDPDRFMGDLSNNALQHQLSSLLQAPVGNHKSPIPFLPNGADWEITDETRKIFFTAGDDLPIFGNEDVKPTAPEETILKNFERLSADQPELLEGIDDSDETKPMKDEDRTANAAKTGEGHIGHYDSVDATHTYLLIQEKNPSDEKVHKLVQELRKMLQLPPGTFSNAKLEGRQVTFKVNPNTLGHNASSVAAKAEEFSSILKGITHLTIEGAGIGDKVKYQPLSPGHDKRLVIVAFAVCGAVAGLLLAVVAAYLVRRHARSREKLQNLAQPDTEASQDYQDLCRQRMQSKSNEKSESSHSVHSPKKNRSLSQEGQVSSSSHSSTSSWNEEPVISNMDISTGHMILSYMEDHLKNKDRLDHEWEALCAYEAELCSTTTGSQPQNLKKNRYTDILPYDHTRVVLNELTNVSQSGYINASSITDHDPRNPAYIATQGTLPQTAADFWQMIWEQGSVVVVMLSRLMENGVAMCHRYWPEEGSEIYHIYEVHLVSEHIWCDDYLVRSFYLKNLKTAETRTVTQFHFMSWPDNGVPNSTKALLEFRRKVNKSYRGRSCPIVVHCSDGIGRTGTYCLIDMVLNRMAKGAKEIDIAATLEHVRDQRAGMVKTKAQFEFVLMAIAEEVHAILKSLSQ